jgi:hypothetical protein
MLLCTKLLSCVKLSRLYRKWLDANRKELGVASLASARLAHEALNPAK